MTLSAAEQRRVLVLNHLEKGAVTVGEAAQLLGISERQVKRLRAEYRREGAGALAHGNRGKRPANALDPQLTKQLLQLAQTTYQGFNQQHLTEMLAEREGLHRSRPTVHRILRTAGISVPRKRRPSRAHHRRDRMAKEGCLLQVDGSRHNWLEGRGPYLTLVGAIDDATGEVDGATFREQEDAQSYFLVLRRGQGKPSQSKCETRAHRLQWQRLRGPRHNRPTRSEATTAGRLLVRAAKRTIACDLCPTDPRQPAKVERYTESSTE